MNNTVKLTKIKTKIKFAKIKSNAIIPNKRAEDAGFDIYACFDEEYITIQPNETKMIPTGIASAFSDNYVIILKERGSTGTKGIGQRAGVIDSGYRGEWMVPITNHNEKPLIITKQQSKSVLEEDFVVYPYNKAICQAILLELPEVMVEVTTYDKLQKIKSERGVGKLGSSGK